MRLANRGEMRRERIETLADPRVDAYRDLREGRLLEEQGLFVAESRHVVWRLLAGGRVSRGPVRRQGSSCGRGAPPRSRGRRTAAR